MRNLHSSALCAAFALAATVSLGSAANAVPIFYTSLAAYQADARLPGSETIVNFDGSAPGTDLTGSTISGATFTAPGASPLTVILGSTGVRFAMSPSSGLNVLSPGGSVPTLENDDLRIDFATPVQGAGIDVVFDAPDGASFVGVSFFDVFGAFLGGSSSIPAPVGAPGYQFVGLVADSAIIGSIVFDESDGSANDDNVAYDTLRFSPGVVVGPPGVPEPATLLLFGAGLAGLGAMRRRRKAKA